MKKRLFKSILNQLNTEPDFKEQSGAQNDALKEEDVSLRHEKNLETFKTLFSIPQNTDIKLREFTVRSLNRRAFILYISTLVDIMQIQEGILEKLIAFDHHSEKIEDIVSYPVITTEKNIGAITELITGGTTALFIEGYPECYLFETTKTPGRTIEKSQNEVIVKGAKEAFNEKVIDNISLLRKKIKNENLIVESQAVSKRSRNDVFFVYEKDLVNEELLQKFKDKLQNWMSIRSSI